ncbi:hypothetical protein J437_LFUL015045 [Ladona fulva]|uniref:Uncharacterized protein n=1 Tax=Ladona fulva TaxID=123851 RepID=A0A8K0K4L5_LADFU|nr:hypothetical protein J437_LFUL015045 [Ladona fulva]
MKIHLILFPWKRGCYFNAGLSHSCDNEDVLSALAEARHLGSFNSPGRRRRRKRQPTMESSNDEDKDTTSTEQYATRKRKNNKGDENKNKNLRVNQLKAATEGKNDELPPNVHSPKRSKRCLSLLGESCANGDVSQSGGDDDYLSGDDNPGKRSFHVQKHISTSKNCLNLLGENCANGDVSGSGSDDDYFGGDDNPGKRSLRMFPNPRKNSITGAGEDDNYFGGDDSPGKRSNHKAQQFLGAYQMFQTPDKYFDLKQLILKRKLVLYCNKYPGSRLCSQLRA